jgi:polyisoprenoid-binding protein YceI
MQYWKTPLIALGGAAALLSLGTLHAQEGPPQLPGQMDVSRVQAGTYALDPNHTLVGWRLNHFGFNDYFGLFGNITGNLNIDPANPQATTLEVTIPISEVTTASSGLTDHLLRPGAEGADPDFFGPNPEPARFVSTGIEVTGETTATVTGDLTMNGQTHPVTIQAEFAGAGANPMSQTQTIGFEGTTTINRSQWGLTSFAPMVGDEVELTLTAAFEKQ